jgi:transposase-like protein
LPGQVFDALGPEFLDASRCRDWLVGHLHPQGPACPWCGIALTSPRSRATFRQLGRVQCIICGRFFTALSGTTLNKTGLEPAGYVLLCLLISLGLGDQAIAQKLNVNRETVRRWRLRFQTLERIWSEQP